jgi:hypothetical protein
MASASVAVSLSLNEKFSLTLKAALATPATEELGRSVSVSAILRAILQGVRKGMISAPAIVEFVRCELETGQKWGSQAGSAGHRESKECSP